MDSLKKPEMILSIVNLIGLVSVAVYGYKKSISVSEELETLRKHLNEIIKRNVEFTASGKKLDDLTDLVKQLNQTITSKDNRLNSINKTVDALNDDVDDLTDTFTQLVKQLTAQGINVKLNQPAEEEPIFSRNRNGRGNNRAGSGGGNNRGRYNNGRGRYGKTEESSDDRQDNDSSDDPDSQASEFRRSRRNYQDS